LRRRRISERWRRRRVDARVAVGAVIMAVALLAGAGEPRCGGHYIFIGCEGLWIGGYTVIESGRIETAQNRRSSCAGNEVIVEVLPVVERPVSRPVGLLDERLLMMSLLATWALV